MGDLPWFCFQQKLLTWSKEAFFLVLCIGVTMEILLCLSGDTANRRSWVVSRNGIAWDRLCSCCPPLPAAVNMHGQPHGCCVARVGDITFRPNESGAILKLAELTHFVSINCVMGEMLPSASRHSHLGICLHFSYTDSNNAKKYV